LAPKYPCQTLMTASIRFRQSLVADRSQGSAATWVRRGGRTPVVAPPVRSVRDSRAPQCRTHPHSRLCLSLSSSPSQGGAPRRHRRRMLPHARAPSSLHLSPIPSISSTPAPSSTLPTPSLDHLSEGEAALADFATAAMCGTSPEFEAAMVGVARPFLVPPFSLP
jgi:hypothetical protein